MLVSQPLFLLLDQLGKLVAVHPVLLYDLRRMHLVVKSVVFRLAVLVTGRILVVVVGRLLRCRRSRFILGRPSAEEAP